MQSLPHILYTSPDLLTQIRAALAADLGGCIVSGMPCEDSLLESLALSLGEPLYEPHHLNQGMICRVEVESRADRPYASTPWHFPGHTDCTDFAEPPDTVLLLCEEPAGKGGNSFVAPLSELLARLRPSDLMELRRPQFYFRYGYLPVLTMANRQLRIRYNRVMLDMFTPEPEPQLKALMDRLDQIIEECSFSFTLSKGDCMILNNHRCVHGRTAFEDDGRRLMKRVRLNLSAG